MRTRTIIVLASLIMLIACALLATRAFGPPVSPSKVALIKSGMSEDDVQTILGLPAEVKPGGRTIDQIDGTNFTPGPAWYYERSFTFGYVMVVFSTNRSVLWATYTPDGPNDY
jgi:hypothetical protein